MAPRNLLVLSALFAAIPSLVLAEGNSAANPPSNPVLVELFTSQGCSSCPPAEAWLNQEGMELFKKGTIIPLAFHVDYWDYLGWKDPFSQSFFTERQKHYAQALADSSLYTPEMVVGGRVGFVGSDGDRAGQEITQAQSRKVTGGFRFTTTRGADGIHLKLKRGKPTPGHKIWAAVFKNGRVTQVARGENAGRTLEENFVVRQLVEIQPDKAGWTVIPWFPMKEDRALTGVVVFEQDDSTMKIFGAQCLYPLP